MTDDPLLSILLLVFALLVVRRASVLSPCAKHDYDFVKSNPHPPRDSHDVRYWSYLYECASCGHRKRTIFEKTEHPNPKP